MDDGIKPSVAGAFALWAGTDHYRLHQAALRRPFCLPEAGINKIYSLHASVGSFRAFDGYAVSYVSESRECLALLPALPLSLRDHPTEEMNFGGLFALLLQQVRREPTVLLLPLAVPAAFTMMVVLFGFWSTFVLHNQDALALFARPGCDMTCVRKVLDIHSLVVLLFLMQSLMLFLPMALLAFQAPRYRLALNYRMIQSHSMASVIFGAVIFAQLLVFFPFRQYGRLVNLGFNPKVERALSAVGGKN